MNSRVPFPKQGSVQVELLGESFKNTDSPSAIMIQLIQENETGGMASQSDEVREA